MSMREKGGSEGSEKTKRLKIDGDSKKNIKRWKSLKEMNYFDRSKAD